MKTRFLLLAYARKIAVNIVPYRRPEFFDMQNKNSRTATKYSDTKFYSCDCPICQAMKKAEDENRNLSEKELHKAFKLANKPRKTIILNYCINRFLESQKGKSKKSL